MSLLAPHLMRLAWLALLPVIAWLLWRLWQRRKRTGRWQAILPPALQPVLLSNRRRGANRRLRWILLGLAWVLACLALVGPSWQRVEQLDTQPQDPLVILLELTPEMLATDVQPNRLDSARRKILDLLGKRRQAQTAIIVYAGSAHVLVPLSDDLSTSQNLLQALVPSIMPEAGQRADLALARARQLLVRAGLGQGRVLLLSHALSEGERQAMARQLQQADAPTLTLLGLGSRDGAPVREENGELRKQADGSILISRLEADTLQGFAEQVGGRYQGLRIDDLDLRQLGLLDSVGLLNDNPRRTRSLPLDQWADQGHWLLLPLLLLAACAGRRGWLFALGLLIVLPSPVYAASFADWWLRPDQQGQRLLQQQQPGEAAEHFHDPRWQGTALYQAGDYAGAAQRFATGDSAADHYNRGNALAQLGELEAAIDAYDQALERQPDLRPALHNRALLERLIEERPKVTTPTASHDEPAPVGGAPGAASDQPSTRSLPGEEQPRTASASSNPQGNAPDGTSALPTRGPESTLDSSPRGVANGEQQQSLEQWLRQIPDNPAELLRRKFWYEQQQHLDKP